MTELTFRNVEADPAGPVDQWPTEAILTALERGGLTDWQKVAAEIRRHPWGEVARKVEEVLSHTRPYGVAELMEQCISDARDHVIDDERDAVAAEVRSLIAASGMTRAEFASRIGTSASRLSTYSTGRVVPTATMMLRMRNKVAEERARQHHRQ